LKHLISYKLKYEYFGVSETSLCFVVSNRLIILYVLDDGEHLTGVKDGSDKKLLVDIMLWAMDNQAPANIMLISGDKDFSYLLHKLGMKRYNILLARPEKASTPLIAAAKTVWLWTSIFNGDCPNIPIDLTTRRHHHDSAYEVSRHLGPKQAQGTKRGRSFCELCNVSCSNHDLTAHLSGRRHRANVSYTFLFLNVCLNIVLSLSLILSSLYGH